MLLIGFDATAVIRFSSVGSRQNYPGDVANIVGAVVGNILSLWSGPAGEAFEFRDVPPGDECAESVRHVGEVDDGIHGGGVRGDGHGVFVERR